MIYQDKIEIKIALIGHVSVGKTTVLNALFREKYSEVSMRRTTAGVNYFRICPKKQKQTKKCSHFGDDVTAVTTDSDITITASKQQWSSLLDADVRTADSTLKEIAADNATLRESTKVHEKFFDIEVEDVPCKMHDDTVLVVVDIPGINEAGSESKYQNYAREKWNTFDCVVLVMDGTKGVNDEEQVKFLQFAKENLKDKKNVPIIILCNKIDEPNDEEQTVLLDETRREVERIFGVKDRHEALANLLGYAAEGLRGPDDIFPVIIVTSAIHAFIYRSVAHMSMERFKKFDSALIDKMGRLEVGKSFWIRLSEDERCETAYRAVTDQEQYHERLQATNFDTFLTALAYAIGDENHQLKLIQKQIATSLRCVVPRRGLVTELSKLHQKLTVVGGKKEDIQVTFWLKYKTLEETVFTEILQTLNVDCLAVAMSELHDYFRLARCVGWNEEEPKAIHGMKGLVRRQLSIVFNKAATAKNVALPASIKDASVASASKKKVKKKGKQASKRGKTTGKQCSMTPMLDTPMLNTSMLNPPMLNKPMLNTPMLNTPMLNTPMLDTPMPINVNTTLTWTSMNTEDWKILCRSVLLLSNNQFFCSAFGREIILLQSLVDSINAWPSTSSSSYCSSCCRTTTYLSNTCQCSSCHTCAKCRSCMSTCFCFSGVTTMVTAFQFVVLDGEPYRLPIPNDLADPSHWGHLAWQYCNFMEANMAVTTVCCRP